MPIRSLTMGDSITSVSPSRTAFTNAPVAWAMSSTSVGSSDTFCTICA